MRLLVVGNLWPHGSHTVRAANVVVYELLRALAGQPGARIGYLRVRRPDEPGQSDVERVAADELRAVGVEILDELVLPAGSPGRPAWKKLIDPRRTDFYPDSIHGGLVTRAAAAFAPDMLFVPWSEWVTALCASLQIPKFAYYGNPDHKAGLHRTSFDRRYGICRYSRLRSAIYLHYLERAHLGVMAEYDLVGDVAANDATYYRQRGHPNAFYVHNVWMDRFGPAWQEMRDRHRSDGPVKIIVNVGQLGGTANRYGMELLGREVAPALRAELAGQPYELHILGKGELIPPLERMLDSPEIIRRGFVDDIDDEMLSSPLFVCLNNGSPYKVGHTRYLHAWSLGCCVIAHRDAALSMPEIRHEENALLGIDGRDIARQIRRALEQPDLARRVGAAGYRTFREYFVAERVAGEIWTRIMQGRESRPDQVTIG